MVHFKTGVGSNIGFRLTAATNIHQINKLAYNLDNHSFCRASCRFYYGICFVIISTIDCRYLLNKFIDRFCLGIDPIYQEYAVVFGQRDVFIEHISFIPENHLMIQLYDNLLILIICSMLPAW